MFIVHATGRDYLLKIILFLVFIKCLYPTKALTRENYGANQLLETSARLGLDTPTSAVATIEVNFIFIDKLGDSDIEFQKELVEEILDHLDDHYVESVQTRSKHGKSSDNILNLKDAESDSKLNTMKFNFQAQIVRLGPTVLEALERIMESSAIDFIYGGEMSEPVPGTGNQKQTHEQHMHELFETHHSSSLPTSKRKIRFSNAHRMSTAIDSLAHSLGLQNETNLFMMDLKPKNLVENVHYGYRGDTHLFKLASYALSIAKQTQNSTLGADRSPLEVLSNVSGILLHQSKKVDSHLSKNPDLKPRQWDVELSTKRKLKPEAENPTTFRISVQDTLDSRKSQVHPSSDRFMSTGESWGRNQIRELEVDETNRENFLNLDDDLNKHGKGSEDNIAGISGDNSLRHLKSSILDEGSLLKSNIQYTLKMLQQSFTTGKNATFAQSFQEVTECSVDSWISGSRSAWIDFGAGPFDWGPTVGGRGIKLGKERRHIVPTLGSFLHSLIVKHTGNIDPVELVSVPQHIAVQFFVVDGHGQKYSSLDVDGNVNGGFDLNGFRRALERMVLPDQTFSFIVHHLDMDEDPDIGVAFVRSLRRSVLPTVNVVTGLIEAKHIQYIDSKVLYESLSRNKNRLLHGSIKPQPKTLNLPVFLFSVDGNTPTYLDIEGQQAVSVKDFVIVVQSESEIWKSPNSCNGKAISQSLRNPSKAAFLATLELWGRIDLTANEGSSSLSIDDWSWSVGKTVFSRLNPSPGIMLSQLEIDSFHRATVAAVLAASHAMQRQAYRTLKAARSVLGDKQQDTIHDLHDVELQLFTCWNSIIDHVRFLEWNAAFRELNPLLRKSRLLLKASNRVAAKAKISCEYLDDSLHKLVNAEVDEVDVMEENIFVQKGDTEDFQNLLSDLMLLSIVTFIIFFALVYLLSPSFRKSFPRLIQYGRKHYDRLPVTRKGLHLNSPRKHK